jgi:hypothetical protein
VSGDYRLLNTQGIKEPHYVPDEVQQGVLVDRLGSVGPTIAPHVYRNSTKTGRSQRGKLMPPRVPRLWKAVAQDDRRALALFHKMEMNSICRDCAIRNPAVGFCVAQTRSTDSANTCQPQTANKFTSPHR